MQCVGVLRDSTTKGDKEVTMQYLDLKGGDRGACKLLGYVIEVLGYLLEVLAATYKRGLATVEEQLISYRKNEVLFCEEVVVFKREVDCKDYEINVLKSEFEKVKQEKESIEFKIEKFEKALKDLDKLLGSQIIDKSNKGLGYNVVPPPHPLIYNRPKKLDLSYYGLDEFKDPEFKSYGSEDKQVSKDISSFVESPLNVDKETVFLDKKIEIEKAVNTARPKAVNTARPHSSVVNDVRFNQANAIKASSCWVWRPTKLDSASITLKKHNYIDARGRYKSISDQPEEQFGVFSAAIALADAARRRQGVKNVQTYTRRSRLVSTADVSTASELGSTAGVKAKDKGKAIMQEFEPPKKIKKRVQVQMSVDDELAKKQLDKREEVVAQAHDIDCSDPANIDWSDPAVLRYHTLQNIPFSIAEDEALSFAQKQPARGSRKKSLARKRARETLSEESAKKQKLEDDTEKEELQVYLNIFLEEESLNIESLATKYPIVDWETRILANDKYYYQIKRADGSVKHYKIFSAMLYDFDRQDVIELYRLVKEIFQTSSPEGYDLVLWGDLKTMIEPNEEDEMWRNQQDWNLIN
ncbi:hypothetical protein Tco_1107102 [Tanacetum coccineum]